MSEVDPYAVLGVAPGASEEEIRAAHRRRSLATHPDAGGDEEEFLAVQAAYESLAIEPAAATPAPVRPRAGAPAPPPERLSRGWWAFLLGAVLVVVVLLVVVLTLASSSGPPADRSTGTSAAPEAAPAAGPPTSLLGSGTLPAAVPADLVPFPGGATIEEVISARGPDDALPTYTIRFAGGDGEPAPALAAYAQRLRDRGWQLASGTDAGGSEALARFTLGSRELQVAVGRDSRERLLWLVGYHGS